VKSVFVVEPTAVNYCIGEDILDTLDERTFKVRVHVRWLKTGTELLQTFKDLPV
jgi:hypothetical protein